jgi:hypothetical protein
MTDDEDEDDDDSSLSSSILHILTKIWRASELWLFFCTYNICKEINLAAGYELYELWAMRRTLIEFVILNART